VSDPKPPKADIIPYHESYAKTVLGWIDTEQVYLRVCRGRNFPPSDDLIDKWQRKGVSSYLLLYLGVALGYAELVHRPLEMAAEISHLMIAPKFRGRGLGAKFVDLLAQRAAEKDEIARVLVNLYNENTDMLELFLKSQFELIGASNYVVGLKLIRPVHKMAAPGSIAG